MKEGWYVNKNDFADVVHVTNKTIEMKHPATEALFYLSLKDNQKPKKTIVPFGFEDSYIPIRDIGAHAKALNKKALECLIISEAIRDAQKSIQYGDSQGSLTPNPPIANNQQITTGPQDRSDE
ncbi:hypothetical protein HOE04_02315 [archaeon]|jgi:hypothetical protein|nr:hypothetical protein [archaeon]